MTRPMTLMIAAAMAAALSAPANALTCEELFASMGREYVPDAGAPVAGLGDVRGIGDCPAGQMMQLMLDPVAVRDARPVTSADELYGTWVSDDVLAIFAGIFIPVYEVLVIAPGEAEGEVRIAQKLVRAVDPAEWFDSNYNSIPAVDVAAAGRIAVYGDHVAALGGTPGELEPRRVRYHDFPIEADRVTGLAMKTRFMSFEQTLPIGVRTNGQRLVFVIADRLAGGERAMSFRKRRPESPELAMMVAVVGETAMLHFTCVMEAMESRSPAYLEALGEHAPEEFTAALRRAFAIGQEREAMMAVPIEDIPEDALEERKTRMIALIEETVALTRDGPLRAFAEMRGAPFGCPELY